MLLFKFILFLTLFLATGFLVSGQVMISQYIEADDGTTPKGIEVYNHSNSSIDFSVDNLELFQGTNGDPCTNKVTINNGILQPNKVWVIGTSELTTYANSNGADIEGMETHGVQFNGNDALELYLGGVKMDVIGTCGSDPGNEWKGNGVSTKDQNIAVKPNICSGTTIPWTDPSLRFQKIADGSTMTGFGDAPICINNTISITSVSSLTYTVECNTSSTGSVSFTSSGTFTTGNSFIVELSDETGSFSNYTSIGTLSLSGTNPSGTINFTIPANTNAGTAYRIRIESDNPLITSADNGSNISINNTAPCAPIVPVEGALLINEFSNGSGGSKEYYELVAVGNCGETIDIRGFIVDDNNGDFGGTGVSKGHFKFSNSTQWSNLPVGAIIVIYNNNDKNSSLPTDDVNDSNNDSVYIIPHSNSSLIEKYYDIPNNNNSHYTPASTTTTGWIPLELGNSNDAAQTRFPNGDYLFWAFLW